MREFDTLVRHDQLNPRTVTDAVTYGIITLTLATLLARALRLTVKEALARADRSTIDRTSVLFLTQLGQIMIYVVALTFYAHVIPELRAVGTALLTSVGVASIVVGVAAQDTLGNIVAGISLIIYRPFEVDDQIQVTAPSGSRPASWRACRSATPCCGPMTIAASSFRTASWPRKRR
jgi:small conductance mechanosensitive channel